ncbi:MAG: hypothetical protein EZS28_006167 [Streblomastix strix]|uniref:Integrase catalytic domain-containing protein n=1 Tax=Streblomastix strix TaxID=222440 RepID=A0A5J4WUP6_9EUKA|nr:MAG: hypothetical protein EZS28_006167 [Streblomastix strix]
MPIFEQLSANITIAIDALEQLHIDWKGIWKINYDAEAEKYNAPLRRARSIRSQDSNRSQFTEQIQRINQPQKPLSSFPFKSKIKQYEKINKVKITQQIQIKDIKAKPLNKLQRPYFSPKLGSWEIDLVFGVNPVTRRRQHYIFAINIKSKYLVVIPLIVDEKNATYISAALKKLINQTQQNEEKIESRGRPKNYSSQEEAERIAAEQ